MKLAVIGSGTMGSGIAQVAAENGITVFLNDTDFHRLRAAQSNISKLLDKKVQKGKLTDGKKKRNNGKDLFVFRTECSCQECRFRNRSYI